MKITTTLAFLSATLFAVFCCDSTANADTFGSGVNSFDIEFVTVGNPNNLADTTGEPDLAGKVEYSYRIGKYEISEGMVDKANAQGGLDILHVNRGPSKPATISWYNAAEFVNWLNIDSGHPPAYKFSGDAFELWQLGDAGYDPDNLYRNSQAKYFLPNVDEWYKAAYYDPASGVYYDFPTGSDSIPDGIDFVGDTTFDAVFRGGSFSTDGTGPNDITDVGVLSPYGTAGQGGNVFEWEETDFDLLNDSPFGCDCDRGYRGGQWLGVHNFMQSSLRWGEEPANASDGGYGFRVASTAEPADLNLDGFVDGLDLGLLLGNFNQNGIPASGGELNGTSPVDGLDLGLLLAAWDPLLPAPARSVPEPGTLMLIGWTAIAGLCYRSLTSLQRTAG